MLFTVMEKQLKTIGTELKTQSDRGAAIIATAIIDNLLEDALRQRLILTLELGDRLFSYGPLANFSAKISLAYAVGILTSEMSSDLDTIRRIRNRFAHTAEPLKFRDTKIRQWTAGLKTGRHQGGKESPRRRFLRVFSGMAFSLALLKDVDIRLKEIFKDPRLREEVEKAAVNRLDQYVDEFDASQRAS
jgi:Mannitol repressor